MNHDHAKLREAVWKKLEWYFGGERQNMRQASKEITALFQTALLEAERRGYDRGFTAGHKAGRNYELIGGDALTAQKEQK